MQAVTTETPEARNRHLSDADRVQEWLSEFEDALRAGDRAELEALFVEDSHWRDLLAFTWNVTPSNTARRDRRQHCCVNSRASKPAHSGSPKGTRRPAASSAPGSRSSRRSSSSRRRPVAASAYCVCLLRSPDKAWLISTSLRELKGYEEPVGGRRPDGTTARIFGGESWAQRRAREQHVRESRAGGV